MKNTLKIILIFSACCIMSCNQKNTEREAREQQQHDDSLKAAIIAEINAQTQPIKNTSTNENTPVTPNASHNNYPNNTNRNENAMSKQQMAGLVSEANSITDAKLQINKLNVLLVNAKSKLEFENTELTRVEQFHIGRTKDEREAAIRNQDLRVQAYQNLVQKIQETIIQLHEKINIMQGDINNASN